MKLDIYPVEDLIWSNKVSGASLRLQLLKLPAMSASELMAFSEQLDELGLSDQLLISDAIGIIFDEGTVWQTLRIGELKAMLTLATGDLEEASQWCSWCHNFDFLPAARQKLYRAVSDLIAFQSNGDSPAALQLFFEDSVLRDAVEIVAGNLTFPGLTFAASWEEVSPAHQNFLNIYNRLRPLKSAAI